MCLWIIMKYVVAMIVMVVDPMEEPFNGSVGRVDDVEQVFNSSSLAAGACEVRRWHLGNLTPLRCYWDGFIYLTEVIDKIPFTFWLQSQPPIPVV
jgi:hypothetical protein